MNFLSFFFFIVNVYIEFVYKIFGKILVLESGRKKKKNIVPISNRSDRTSPLNCSQFEDVYKFRSIVHPLSIEHRIKDF